MDPLKQEEILQERNQVQGWKALPEVPLQKLLLRKDLLLR